MSKIIVYDTDHPGGVRNICFAESYATQGPGHGFTVELAEKARIQGLEIVTGDVFLKNGYSNKTAFCVTDMRSIRTNLLLRKGVIPMFCFLTESPIIARDFYIDIEKYAGRFIHNIQFRGTAPRLGKTPTHFSVMYYPIDQRIPIPPQNWNDKKFLILVNRNKRMFRSDHSNLKGYLLSISSYFKSEIQKIIDPWIRSREIYKDRIEAIRYFSTKNQFDLYGQGWNNKIPGFSVRYHHAAKLVYKGEIEPDRKLRVMNNYKFSLCFENCAFPGYVTEKIFDCFLSSCIPIYFGAPDITDFVPADTFIDFRRFKSLGQLEVYFKSFTEDDATRMLENAKNFLSSQEFDKFYTPNVVDSIINRIINYQV